MNIKNKIIRVDVKAFDYKLIEKYLIEIMSVLNETNNFIKGPIILPTKIKKFTLLTSPNIDKDSRDQYEIRTYHRIIDIINPNVVTIEKIIKLKKIYGVNIIIKKIR